MVGHAVISIGGFQSFFGSCVVFLFKLILKYMAILQIISKSMLY